MAMSWQCLLQGVAYTLRLGLVVAGVQVERGDGFAAEHGDVALVIVDGELGLEAAFT